MQAETVAARLEARAREAEAAAAARGSARQVRTKNTTIDGTRGRGTKADRSVEASRGRRRRRGQKRGGGGEAARESRPLMEVLGEAKEVMDDGVREGSTSPALSAQGGASGARGGGRAEVWVPSAARVDSPITRFRKKEHDTPRKARRMEEDRAMRRRLEHLGMVTARLENTEAGIEAKLDLLAKEESRSTGHRSRPKYARELRDDGLGRGRSGLGVGSGGDGGSDGDFDSRVARVKHERALRRRDENNLSRRPLSAAARGGHKVRAPRSVGRLAAPTVSSNKAKPPGVGGGAAEWDTTEPPTKRQGERRRTSAGGKGGVCTYSKGAAVRGERVAGGSGCAASGRKERMTRVKSGAIARARGRPARGADRGIATVPTESEERRGRAPGTDVLESGGISRSASSVRGGGNSDEGGMGSARRGVLEDAVGWEDERRRGRERLRQRGAAKRVAARGGSAERTRGIPVSQGRGWSDENDEAGEEDLGVVERKDGDFVGGAGSPSVRDEQKAEDGVRPAGYV